MQQTNNSVQYQIFLRPPGTLRWMPSYPYEMYDKPEHALSYIKIYQQWDIKHERLRYEYCIATVRTSYEYGEAMING